MAENETPEPIRGWSSADVVLKDAEGYTATISVEARLVPASVSVENDPPGKATLNGFGIEGSAYISNTTVGRVNHVGNLQVVALIKIAASDCEQAVKAPTQQQDIDTIRIPGSKLVWCPVASSGPYALQADLEPDERLKSLTFSNYAGMSFANMNEKSTRALVTRYDQAEEAYILYNAGSDQPAYSGKERFGARILASSSGLT